MSDYNVLDTINTTISRLGGGVATIQDEGKFHTFFTGFLPMQNTDLLVGRWLSWNRRLEKFAYIDGINQEAMPSWYIPGEIFACNQGPQPFHRAMALRLGGNAELSDWLWLLQRLDNNRAKLVSFVEKC